MKTKTTEEFIKKVIEIYGDFFDLSKVNYINNHTNVEIYCKHHGLLKITPNKLLTIKRGCIKCNKINKSSKTLEKNIKIAKEIHNNKYDYSKTKFNNLSKKVIITCPIHYDFEQNISDHIRGHGCPKCSGKKLTTKEWIKLLSEIHNYKYDYSKFIFIHSTTKSEVICPEHGSFFISPSKHKNGGNCQSCAINIMSLKVRLKTIERISKNKLNGHQLMPAFNKNACKIFDKISKKENIHIKHAMNGGEYYIKELGYWLDGYDEINNIAYEYDERYHFKNGKLKEKDIIRQKEIENNLKCQFTRIKYL